MIIAYFFLERTDNKKSFLGLKMKIINIIWNWYEVKRVSAGMNDD